VCIFSLLFSISCWCSVRMPTWIASCFGRYVLSAIHVHCEFWLVILHWEGGGLESEKLCPCWGFQVFLFFFTACVTICSNRLNDIRNICQICESKSTIIICQNLNIWAQFADDKPVPGQGALEQGSGSSESWMAVGLGRGAVPAVSNLERVQTLLGPGSVCLVWAAGPDRLGLQSRSLALCWANG
jgi:hypothetical protein